MVGIDETNLLSLVSPWLDNNYHKQTKMLQCREIFPFTKKVQIKKKKKSPDGPILSYSAFSSTHLPPSPPAQRQRVTSLPILLGSTPPPPPPRSASGVLQYAAARFATRDEFLVQVRNFAANWKGLLTQNKMASIAPPSSASCARRVPQSFQLGLILH